MPSRIILNLLMSPADRENAANIISLILYADQLSQKAVLLLIRVDKTK